MGFFLLVKKKGTLLIPLHSHAYMVGTIMLNCKREERRKGGHLEGLVKDVVGHT